MNRKLLHSVREYKKESFLTPVLVCLEVLMEVLIPLLMANIIDVGIANGDMGYIIRMGVLLVVMAMLALLFGAKAGQMARSHLPGMQRICAMIFFIRYRISLSEISTIFQPPVL